MRILALAALPLLPLLAACTDERAPSPQGEAAPIGEVLEGSISDEMIAYDRLRSQPPLVAPPPTEATSVGLPAGAGPNTAPEAPGEDGEPAGATPIREAPVGDAPAPVPPA